MVMAPSWVEEKTSFVKDPWGGCQFSTCTSVGGQQPYITTYTMNTYIRSELLSAVRFFFLVAATAGDVHVAPSPRGGMDEALSSTPQDPGPLPNPRSSGSNKPLLAEPSRENATTTDAPSSANCA